MLIKSLIIVILIIVMFNKLDAGKSECKMMDELAAEPFPEPCGCPCTSMCPSMMPTMAPMLPMVPMVPPVVPMMMMSMLTARKIKRSMNQALIKVATRAFRRHFIMKRSIKVSKLRRRSKKKSKKLKTKKTTPLINVRDSSKHVRVKRQMPPLPNPSQIMQVAMMIMNMIFPGLGNVMYNGMAYGAAMARLKRNKKMAKKAAKRDWKEGKMRIMQRFMAGQLPVPQDFAENAYSTFEFPTMQGTMDIPSMIPGAGQMSLMDYAGVMQMINGAKRRRRR